MGIKDGDETTFFFFRRFVTWVSDCCWMNAFHTQTHHFSFEYIFRHEFEWICTKKLIIFLQHNAETHHSEAWWWSHQAVCYPWLLLWWRPSLDMDQLLIEGVLLEEAQLCYILLASTTAHLNFSIMGYVKNMSYICQGLSEIMAPCCVMKPSCIQSVWLTTVRAFITNCIHFIIKL